jgi:type II pantothenate kinase
VDFGGTNVDVLVSRDGALARRFVPAGRQMSVELLRSLLADSGVEGPAGLRVLAVTGGRCRELPDAIDGAPIVKVDELRAIARGGLTATGLREALVVSLGTGTALVGARGREVQPMVGSGVGGGTLLGLSRLLLGTTDAAEVDALARRGDAGWIDLTVGDIAGGSVGVVPAGATAAHFGKASGVVAGVWSGHADQHGRENVAAAIMNLVGQTTVRLALLASAATGFRPVVLTGHLMDLPAFRQAAGVPAGLAGGRLVVPSQPGFAVALGALVAASEEIDGT